MAYINNPKVQYVDIRKDTNKSEEVILLHRKHFPILPASKKSKITQLMEDPVIEKIMVVLYSPPTSIDVSYSHIDVSFPYIDVNAVD